MIFARTNRSTVLLVVAALGVTVALVVAAAVLLVLTDRLGALVVAMLGAVSLAAALRAVRRLRRWPVSRLGLFRDRLVLVQGRCELQAVWDLVEFATLADQGDWSTARWPELRITDRLTVRLAGLRRFSFRPATFGLDPIACRDLILRLRDDPGLRRRLPEFDSVLDLSQRPLQTGELIRPQI